MCASQTRQQRLNMFSPSSSSLATRSRHGADDFLVRYSPSRCSATRFNMQNESARALTHAFTRLSDHQRNGTSERWRKKKVMAKRHKCHQPTEWKIFVIINSVFVKREISRTHRSYVMTATMMSHGNLRVNFIFSEFIFRLRRTARLQSVPLPPVCPIAFTHHIDRMSLRHSVAVRSQNETRKWKWMKKKQWKKISSLPEVHTWCWWRRRRRRRPSKLAIVHARHGNNCIECRRPTQWTQREHVNETSTSTTSTERPLVLVRQPDQRNENQIKIVRTNFFLSLVSLLSRRFNRHAFYGNEMRTRKCAWQSAVVAKKPTESLTNSVRNKNKWENRMVQLFICVNYDERDQVSISMDFHQYHWLVDCTLRRERDSRLTMHSETISQFRVWFRLFYAVASRRLPPLQSIVIECFSFHPSISISSFNFTPHSHRCLSHKAQRNKKCRKSIRSSNTNVRLESLPNVDGKRKLP